MASRSSAVQVHIEGDVLLAVAGLTRAAARAGLQVVPADQPASFTLRSVTIPPTGPGLDVFVGGEHIQIVVHGTPSRATWNAILPLIQQLTGDAIDHAACGGH